MAFNFNYDYSKTLWMKMFLATPDFDKNCSVVHISFEQALEIVKAVDNITQGIPKIIYLVGWQGLGHDDCWPEMDAVNEYLKRESDATAKDSFMWLYEEAKKYNTVISVHINISDAVKEDGIFFELKAANALCNDINGNPAVLQILNNRNCYKTSYKQLWESGIFKRLFDRFLEIIPAAEAGTVHIDNFCISESLNPKTYHDEQNEARNQILDYIYEKGIDVTSEYTYREAHFRNESITHPNREMYAEAGEDMTEIPWESIPIHTLGKIPATWWTSQVSMKECIDIKPSLYSGHLNDKAQIPVFYGVMHGEDIWQKYGTNADIWAPAFIKEFCTYHVPYVYLNRYKRLGFTENPDAEYEKKYTVQFSDGVVSSATDRSITKNGIILKKENNVILPLTEDNKTFIAYSENGRNGQWSVPDADFSTASVYNISANGNEYICDVSVKDKRISLNVNAGQAVAIKAK